MFLGIVLYRVTRGIARLDRGYSQIRSSAWLEHYTDNVGVSSSNLLGSTVRSGSMSQVREGKRKDDAHESPGGLAQLARAPALQAGGHRFDSDILHKESSLKEVSIDVITRESCWSAGSQSGHQRVLSDKDKLFDILGKKVVIPSNFYVIFPDHRRGGKTP
jgi:hypothetical protein